MTNGGNPQFGMVSGEYNVLTNENPHLKYDDIK